MYEEIIDINSKSWFFECQIETSQPSYMILQSAMNSAMTDYDTALLF